MIAKSFRVAAFAAVVCGSVQGAEAQYVCDGGFCRPQSRAAVPRNTIYEQQQQQQAAVQSQWQRWAAETAQRVQSLEQRLAAQEQSLTQITADLQRVADQIRPLAKIDAAVQDLRNREVVSLDDLRRQIDARIVATIQAERGTLEQHATGAARELIERELARVPAAAPVVRDVTWLVSISRFAAAAGFPVGAAVIGSAAAVYLLRRKKKGRADVA